MDHGFSSVMKDISIALKLDSESHYEEAYIKYLESIQNVISGLLSFLRTNGGRIIITDNVKRYVKVGLQCMERVSALLEHIGNHSTTYSSSSSSLGLSKHADTDSQSTETVSNTTSSANFTNIHQQDSMKRPINEKTNLFSAPVPPLPPPHASHLYVKPMEVSPLDMAYKRNEQMLKAYKARLARINAGKGKAAATTMSLTIQRKLAENLAIAKVKEEALAKKMKERQQRLEKEAARRFTMPVGLSKEEKEQRQLYKKILDYEHDVQWLHVWRQKIESSPKDPIIINQLIQEILRCLDHPLSKLLSEYQTKIYERIYPLIIKKIPMIEEVQVPLAQHLFPFKDVVDENKLLLDIMNQPSEKSGSVVNNNNSLTSIPLQEKIGDVSYSESDGLTPSSQSTSLTQSDDQPTSSFTSFEGSCYDVDPTSKFDSELNFHGDSEDVVNVFRNSKSELKKAMSKGKILQKSFEEGNEKLREIAIDATKDLEKYNVDSMDDLFDTSDSEEKSDVDNKQSMASLENIINKDEIQVKRDNSSDVLNDIKEGEFQRLRSEAIERHLNTVSVDVNNFLEKLIVMFTISYEQLNSPEGRDQCYAALEEAFFKPVWKYILYIYRLANRTKEIALAYVMTKAIDISPADMGIRKTLLHINTNSEETDTSTPYQEVIDEVGNLTHHYTLLSKLECVVKISKQICQCVEAYHQESHGGDTDHMPSIGADDLLPILTYVIIKSGSPQIVAECQAMLEFIHEGYLMGEEGYCLTSLQTAINYLVSTADKW